MWEPKAQKWSPLSVVEVCVYMAFSLQAALVGGLFLLVLGGALAAMAFLSWRGSQPSDFFAEAVAPKYELEMAETEINLYYELKERMRQKRAPEVSPDDDGGGGTDEDGEAREPWLQRLKDEERTILHKSLHRRLVCCLDRLDQIHKDKPGNWKLWREKLVSEAFWESFCEAEKIVGEEIEFCLAEADRIFPGMKEQVFSHAVQHWRMTKQKEEEKKAKTTEGDAEGAAQEAGAPEKSQKTEEEDRKQQELAAQQAMEDLLKEEEKQQKKDKKAAAKPTAAGKAKAKKK